MQIYPVANARHHMIIFIYFIFYYPNEWPFDFQIWFKLNRRLPAWQKRPCFSSYFSSRLKVGRRTRLIALKDGVMDKTTPDGQTYTLWIWSNRAEVHTDWPSHYGDVIMGPITSQITSLMIVYSNVYSDADQRNHQSSESLAFVREFTGDRWIPRTKGQLRGKCFHLMTSSCCGVSRVTVSNDNENTNRTDY